MSNKVLLVEALTRMTHRNNMMVQNPQILKKLSCIHHFLPWELCLEVGANMVGWDVTFLDMQHYFELAEDARIRDEAYERRRASARQWAEENKLKKLS